MLDSPFLIILEYLFVVYPFCVTIVILFVYEKSKL